MGHDASMELGKDIRIMVDKDSTQYEQGIKSGLISLDSPALAFNPESGVVDAISSATEKYFASRGLSNTTINGYNIDVTHLHIREWIHCIRTKETPSANIDLAYEEGIACLMAHQSYVEQRVVKWDDKLKKII